MFQFLSMDLHKYFCFNLDFFPFNVIELKIFVGAAFGSPPSALIFLKFDFRVYM